MSLHRLFFRVLVSITIVLSLGCGQKKVDHEPVFAVRGQVLVRGQPAVKATVIFHATGPSKRLMPHGTTDDKGYFELTSYNLNDGAADGSYAVTIVWPMLSPNGVEDEMMEGRDRLNGRYSDPQKTAIRVQVEKKPNQLPQFQLQ